MLHPTLIDEMRIKSEDDMTQYHHSLGRWIRNNWGLWAGARLSKYFNELGIKHLMICPASSSRRNIVKHAEATEARVSVKQQNAGRESLVRFLHHDRAAVGALQKSQTQFL